MRSALPLHGLRLSRPARARWAWLLLGCWLWAWPLLACADSYDERRVRTGARLFRSLLAADTGLDKKVNAKGELEVWVYSTDPRLGAEILALVAPPGDPAKSSVRGLPLKAKLIDTLPAAGSKPKPVGLFLASAPPPAALQSLIGWSNAARCILFSPFEGHVELGVVAGLAIEAKVQPFLNQRALTASGLVLKPFFLKVAKVVQ